jgi:hypothetical protein
VDRYGFFLDKCGVIFVVVATGFGGLVAAATAATTDFIFEYANNKQLSEVDNDQHIQHGFFSTKRTKTNYFD